MIKVSVISTRGRYKLVIKAVIIIAILFVLSRIIKLSKSNLGKIEIDTNRCLSYVTDQVKFMGDLNKGELPQFSPETVLSSEFRVAQSVVSRDSYCTDDDEILYDNEASNQDSTQISDSQDGNIDENVVEVNTGVETQVQKATYKETYNCEIDGVKIKNETDYDLNKLQISSSNCKVKSKNVLIFHTHTCESYTPTEQEKYESSGNYRTLDLNHSVVRVGDELEKYLKNFGFKVIHNKTFHDYPAYTGSYGRSLKTVSSILAQNKETDIVIDLHRDAMSDETYAPKVKIGDEYVSQIMFVIGSNGSGLEHNNWEKNLEFAIKVQKKANEMYPGLFKPIILRNARYNQHLSSAATIMEFGATGNTLEECEGAAKYLAKVLDEIY